MLIRGRISVYARIIKSLLTCLNAAKFDFAIFNMSVDRIAAIFRLYCLAAIHGQGTMYVKLPFLEVRMLRYCD